MKITLDDKKVLNFFNQAVDKKLSLEKYVEDLITQLDDRIVSQPGFRVSIDTKLALSEKIIKDSINDYGLENIAVAWTGGKDSTLIMWMLKRLIENEKLKWPMVMLINEGNMFDEILDFSNKLSKNWKFDYEEVKNEDVLSQVKKVGDSVNVSKLSQRNKSELKRLDVKNKSFTFDPESMVGNHLMKTVVQNEYIEKNKVKALVTGIRWDEQDARHNETYISPRGDDFTPDHVRVHPILHFTEADVWEATLGNEVPYCELYKEGYRSLGAKGTTTKKSDKPAWEQDLESTTEREGRAQDKEEIMKRLRDLGYM